MWFGTLSQHAVIGTSSIRAHVKNKLTIIKRFFLGWYLEQSLEIANGEATLLRTETNI